MILIAIIAPSGAETIYCDNCSDCSEKIQSAVPGDIVMLTQDITNFDGNCICFNGTDNVMFDGSGHTISGVSRHLSGVYLSAYSQSNTVQNLSVTNFRQGVYLFDSDYNHVNNITSYANSEGITLLYGLSNTIEDCDLYENRYYDFHFVPNLRQDCYNNVWNVTGSGGDPIGFYVGDEDLSDMEFSSLCLCDVDNSSIDNVTIAGLSTLNNNGLRLYFTDNTTLTNITTTGNYNGIDMTSCNWNLFSDVDCSYVAGSGHGIHAYRCDNNTFLNITANYGRQTGIRLFHSDNNIVTNATVMNSYDFGIYFTQSSNNTLNDSIVTGTSTYAKSFSIYKGQDNLIYNNYLDSTNNVGVTSGYSNVWNVTPTAGNPIIDVPLMGGNYWHGYTGIDDNEDGFIDLPYVIDENNTDYLPLQEVGTPQMYIRNDGYDIVVGETWEFLVTCRNESGYDINCTNLTWYCDNETVGTISPTFSDGANFTGLAVGSANVTVSGYGLSDTVLQNVTASSEICGDVNCDGTISMTDVMQTYYRFMDSEYPLECEWAADVDGDGTISMTDVMMIYYKFMDSSYPLDCSD